MKILALDPSSTCTGYAVMDGPGGVLDAGLLKGERSGDGSEARIEAMVGAVRELIGEHTPGVVVIEMPSGKVGSGQRKGASASLTIYGVAAGEIRRAVKMTLPAELAGPRESRVVSISEREWTRRLSKKTRQAAIAGLFPGYAAGMGLDGGGDMADAIGLGRWWWIERGAVGCAVEKRGRACG